MSNDRARWKRPGIRLAILLLIVLGGYFLSIFVKQSWNFYRLRRELREQERRVAQMREENQALQRLLEQYNTPGGREELVKRSLPFKRAGERLIILVTAEASPTTPSRPAESGSRSSEELAELPTWQLWLRVVFPPATGP
ncbi:MAG: septum formation initiator family protein [Chloroflexia bacterium]